MTHIMKVNNFFIICMMYVIAEGSMYANAVTEKRIIENTKKNRNDRRCFNLFILIIRAACPGALSCFRIV